MSSTEVQLMNAAGLRRAPQGRIAGEPGWIFPARFGLMGQPEILKFYYSLIESVVGELLATRKSVCA